MTQLKDALAAAGIKDPQERLRDIALKALVANASKSDYTVKATEQIWAEIQKDKILLIALFNPYGEYRAAIGRILRHLKQDLAVKEQSAKPLSTSEKRAMTIVKAEREEERRERAEQLAAERAEQARRDREYQEYLASWHKTPLFDVTVSGTPIWQVSAGTVRAWLPTQKRKLRAIELLIDGIPEDGRPIEFYRTPDDVREIWRICADEGELVA